MVMQPEIQRKNQTHEFPGAWLIRTKGPLALVICVPWEETR